MKKFIKSIDWYEVFWFVVAALVFLPPLIHEAIVTPSGTH